MTTLTPFDGQQISEYGEVSGVRVTIAITYRVPERAQFDDALIGAVAQAGGLTVVTRNTRHFEPLGVPCLNPWNTESL